MRFITTLLLVTIVTAAADLPRDPKSTLQRAENGVIRVGVVENAPWAVKQGTEADGVEAELVKRLAHELRATPEWHWGGEQAHMEALERYELDLVIGGLTKQTPWKKTIGLTAPYFDAHVMATPPGENAWIKRLDEFLASQRPLIPSVLEKQSQSQ